MAVDGGGWYTDADGIAGSNSARPNNLTEERAERILLDVKNRKMETDRFCAEAAASIAQATIHLADTAIAVLQIVARNQ